MRVHSFYSYTEREREREGSSETKRRVASLVFASIHLRSTFYNVLPRVPLFLLSFFDFPYSCSLQILGLVHNLTYWISSLLFFSVLFNSCYDVWFFIFFNFFLICQIPETLPIFVIFINLRNLDYLQTGWGRNLNYLKKKNWNYSKWNPK